MSQAFVPQPPIHQPPSYQEDEQTLMPFASQVTEDAVGDFDDRFVNFMSGDENYGDVDPISPFVPDFDNTVPAKL